MTVVIGTYHADDKAELLELFSRTDSSETPEKCKGFNEQWSSEASSATGQNTITAFTQVNGQTPAPTTVGARNSASSADCTCSDDGISVGAVIGIVFGVGM